MSAQVLVLNQNYEPLTVCGWQRAVSMVYVGKAHVVEEDSLILHSPTTQMRLPTVVRLSYHVKRPIPKLKLSRQNLLARDRFACQYCGRRGKLMTVDHVIPRDRGGTSSWDNLVICCAACNNRKANPRRARPECPDPPPAQAELHPIPELQRLHRGGETRGRYYLEPFRTHLVGLRPPEPPSQTGRLPRPVSSCTPQDPPPRPPKCIHRAGGT